jgi:transcription elongation factor GreA
MSARPAMSTVPLTRHARRALAAKEHHLRKQVIPELAGLLGDPDRDGRIDEDYHRATRELTELRAVLGRAEPVELLPDDPHRVDLGEAVTIRLEDGTLERYVVVHPAEVTLGGLRASALSPLGAALLGRRVGDEVDVAAPGGTYRCVIVSIERQPYAHDDTLMPDVN